MLYCDTRIGGVERWWLRRPDDYMQVPDEIRKCVAFLGCRRADGSVEVGGTAFFVAPEVNEEFHFSYAVTAGHCIDEIAKRGCKTVLVRMNLRDGGLRWVDTSINEWLRHPTDVTVDAAVLSFGLPDEADHMVFPVAGFADREFMNYNEIGLGDEVFLPGLFRPHQGRRKNIPIIRMGSIAAMPEEPISTAMGDMEAYLIECRSIGGLSGSPVFVWPGLVRFVNSELRTASNPLKSFRLLGLMHGHFKLPPFHKIMGDDPVTRERLNMGIAIVPTSSKILEVLNQPLILEHEANRLERARRDGLPVPD